MILGQETKPSLESLTHSGVKGMKWGKHKTKVSTSDIKEARNEVVGLQSTVNSKIHQLNTVTNPRSPGSKGQQTKAVNEFHKAVKDLNTSDAHVNANRFTNGEKAALLVLGGPVGAVIIGGAALDRKRIAKNVAKAKAQ